MYTTGTLLPTSKAPGGTREEKTKFEAPGTIETTVTTKNSTDVLKEAL